MEKYVLVRMTRLDEEPGQKNHGRKSATPIIYQIHVVGCEKEPEGKVLTAEQVAATVAEHCMKRRHLMTCMSCESNEIADKIKSTM